MKMLLNTIKRSVELFEDLIKTTEGDLIDDRDLADYFTGKMQAYQMALGRLKHIQGMAKTYAELDETEKALA